MDFGDALPLQQGVVFEGLKPEIRDSSISWIDPNSWITGLCNHYFNMLTQKLAGT